jgi:hypothetical protein
MQHTLTIMSLSLSCTLLAACPTLDAGDGSGSAAGSGSSSHGNSACSPLDGIYRVSYSQSSGSCGPQSDELIEYRNGVAVATGASSCQAGGEVMTSPCELRRSSTCALSDGLSGALLGYATVSGTLSETQGNERLEGSLDVTLTDNTGSSCDSTYHVVVAKTR